MPYSESEAVLGSGSTLGYAATAEGPFTIYAEITKLSLPKKAVAKVKVTNMQSLNSTHENLPGFIDSGDVEAELNFTPTTYLQADEDTRKVQYFQVTLPSNEVGTDDDFVPALVGVLKGWISELSAESPTEDKITAKMKVTVTGKVAWTE